MKSDRGADSGRETEVRRLSLVVVTACAMASLLLGVTAAPSPASATVVTASASASASAMSGRVIVDVDAGADDGLALLILLGAEKAGVVSVDAITCANGNTRLPNVVYNVFRVLEAAGRLDIPVYAGAERSLVETEPTDNFFGADGFGGDSEPSEEELRRHRPSAEHAAHFLRRALNDSPGEISLLCLAPLTNLALAERLQSGVLAKARRIIALQGSVAGRGNVRPGVEFNSYMDPEAFHVVLQAAGESGRPLLLVPWEAVGVANNIDLRWRKEVLGAVDSPGIRLLNAAEHRALSLVDEGDGEGGRGRWVSADEQAAVAALDRRVLADVTPPLLVSVELGRGPARGTCQVDYSHLFNHTAPTAEIVLALHPKKLKEAMLFYVQQLATADDQ